MLTGPAGLVWMGLSSAGIEAAQQNLSGVSAWEAVGYSTAMGMVEVLTEKLPFDELLDLAKDVKSIKDYLKKSFKAMGMDMSGEALATGTQNYLDMLLLGEDSRYWQRVNELMSGDTPLTSTQAQATARFELFFFEPAYSAGIGMGSTIGMSGTILGGHLLRNGINKLKNGGNQTADNQSTATDISQPKPQSIEQAQDGMAQAQLMDTPELPMLPASPERLLLTEGQTANNSDMTSTNTTAVSETTAKQPATVGQAIEQLSQQDPNAKVSKETGNAIARVVGDMLDMGSAIPRGVRGAIMAAYRTFEAGGTNGQAVALLTTANQSIVTAIANGLSTKADVRGLVALHDSMRVALTQTEQHSDAVAANAANDVGALFSSYFDGIGADEMPSLSEFAKLYREGGNAWQELTLRKQWKEAVRNGEIGFFTEFDEYKAMAQIDSEGGVGDNNKRNIVETGGIRNEKPLTKEQIKMLMNYVEQLGFKKENVVVCDQYCTTPTGIWMGILFINNDVLPAEGSGKYANSKISGKGAIAHEIIGHYEAVIAGRAFNIDSIYNQALDEAQASIRAARFAPGLTMEERYILMRDGLTRLKNQRIRLKDVQGLLYIYER